MRDLKMKTFSEGPLYTPEDACKIQNVVWGKCERIANIVVFGGKYRYQMYVVLFTSF
jgi:hypothetical protein